VNFRSFKPSSKKDSRWEKKGGRKVHRDNSEKVSEDNVTLSKHNTDAKEMTKRGPVGSNSKTCEKQFGPNSKGLMLKELRRKKNTKTSQRRTAEMRDEGDVSSTRTDCSTYGKGKQESDKNTASPPWIT